MKDFVKMTLAVICGMIILCFASMFFFAGMAASLAVAGSSSKPVIPKSAVLKIDMSAITLSEQSQGSNPFASPLASLNGPKTDVVGLWDAVQAVNAAAEDPAVKYIYLRPDVVYAGMAQLYEFRKSLEKFRASGKAIVAYMDNVSTGGYYLASVADKVYMTAHQGGTSTFTGISGQLFFLKDLLDRLGINVQLIRHGKYKSAGEMYIKNAASPENMEQNQVMIDSIWSQYAADMAASRGITVEQLNSLLDNLALNFPEDFLNASLVDGLLTLSELKAKLADLFVVDSFDDVKMVSFSDYVAAKSVANVKSHNKIAVIYADGQIIDGNDKKEVAGDRFAEVISKVRADSTIKAVVFRVNSPGGSVLASEKIKAEIDLLAKERPLVASYGSYAASGGYWISAASGRIFADPVSLTGSIGVFSMIPDASGTLKKIAHVNFTPVKSNRHSDMLSLMRPLDAAETDYMQASVEAIYDRFVNIVAEGRDLTPAHVDSVAQGRVWSGADALGIGLVDKLGTLEDAIEYAVAIASENAEDIDVKKWNIEAYPKPMTTMEMILDSFGMGGNSVKVFKGTPLESVEQAANAWARTWEHKSSALMMARMPYDIVWAE